MEFETNKFGPNAKMSMQNKLRAYRVDIDIMQKDLVRGFTFFSSDLTTFVLIDYFF